MLSFSFRKLLEHKKRKGVVVIGREHESRKNRSAATDEQGSTSMVGNDATHNTIDVERQSERPNAQAQTSGSSSPQQTATLTNTVIIPPPDYDDYDGMLPEPPPYP